MSIAGTCCVLVTLFILSVNARPNENALSETTKDDEHEPRQFAVVGTVTVLFLLFNTILVFLSGVLSDVRNSREPLETIEQKQDTAQLLSSKNVFEFLDSFQNRYRETQDEIQSTYREEQDIDQVASEDEVHEEILEAPQYSSYTDILLSHDPTSTSTTEASMNTVLQRLVEQKSSLLALQDQDRSRLMEALQQQKRR